MPGEHAIYAPSSAERWLVCTASAPGIAASGLSLDLADGADETGTHAHDEIERILGQFNGQIVEPAAIVEASKRLLDVDHPAAYGVALVLDYVGKLPRGRIWVEQRVKLTDDIWGRCDISHFDEVTATLTIVDYKNGYVDVQAIKNAQLRIYGGGAIRTFGIKPKWVRYVVVQPNSFMPVPRVKQWIESAEDLAAFIATAEKIPEARQEFVAGDQCTYCPLFGRCPASRDILVKLGTALAGPAEDLHPDQIAYFYAMEKPIEDWFKLFHKVWSKRAINGGTVPAGMKIVTAITKRAWRDEDAARKFVFEQKGIDALNPPTPAQAEKLGLNIDALATKPEGAPVLALESDSRAEFKRRTAAEMFAGVGKQ